jgi:hypothetical protein
MSNKSIKIDQGIAIEAKNESSSKETKELPKKGWDISFSRLINEEKKLCKKVRFKWVC